MTLLLSAQGLTKGYGPRPLFAESRALFAGIAGALLEALALLLKTTGTLRRARRRLA